MSRVTILLLVTLILGFPGLALSQNAPSITASLNSSFVVEGERTLLNVELNGLQTIGWPTSPRVAPLTLKQEGQGHIQRNGRIREVFQYAVSSYQPGIFTIPPFEVVTNRGTFQSKPLTLRVFSADSLSVNGLRVDSRTIPYLTAVLLERDSPYQGEPQKVEAKLYLPRGQPHFLSMRYPTMVNLEKNGMAAWRFDGSREPSGVLIREGITFNVFTYYSSITPLQEGSLTLGPGTASPVIQRRVQSRGRFLSKEEALQFKFPAVSLTARPLPSPAPDGFDGAVGNFSISASPLNKELELGDTVNVELKINGTGNIAQLPGPQLEDPEGNWKQFEISRTAQGNERRSTSGTVEFTQVVRPNKKVKNLPPYRFVFFDPVLEKYRTIRSLPQALVITGDLQSLDDDAASQALAFLTPSNRALRKFSSAPGTPVWVWQLLPAFVVLALLGIWGRRAIQSRNLASLPAREFQGELQEISRLANDRVQFYRAASNFVTRWRGQEDYQEIHDTRDAICFAPESEPEPLPGTEKNRILNLLKQLSPILLVGLFFALQTGSATALPDDPALAKKEILEALSSNPSPEHYYNLALCEDALDNPGQAALAAYRFELHGGDSEELLKQIPGLRAFEREGTHFVSLLPLAFYQQSLAAALWTLAILILLVLLFPGPRPKWISPTLASISILGLVIGITGWALYPEEVSYKPLKEMSVVVAPSPLQRQPYEGGEAIRDEIVGSLCFVDATPGDWAHVELPGGLKGWVPRSSVQPIVE